MSWINLASWLSSTEAEGPGRRAALWVQGCQFLCPGCCNPSFLRIAPRDLVTAESLVERLSAAKAEHNIEGLTMLGGEPLLQAKGLSELAAGAQGLGLSVMVFTGYTLEELRSDPLPGSERLLDHTDVLVDGRFVAELPEQHRAWAGSSNQRFHYLTDRYESTIEQTDGASQRVEIRFSESGRVEVNGWPADFKAKGNA
ncbi:4Fe-4S single cluster domain-containing protein [Tessaracoccus flavescens]|uniref:Radical SAM protein n=1 Tax=Tessaracoccus flavescens TaxID=399497 RepID=A0A1Q2D1H6_9ACTN|nr:4Fe-4S single cluster domain-containing protein [Tessaracoccus flavescens]AQP52207.1 radical SAM protein [Tessaracoccus flavescens]